MSTHTTLTDIRYIMRLHKQGVSSEDIKKTLGIDVTEINRIIDVKTPKKKAKKKAEVKTPETTE